MVDRLPTHDDLAEWKRDTKSDVRTAREETKDLRGETTALRDRVTALETKVGSFHDWHRPAFDELRQDVNRLKLWAVAVAAGTGGSVAALIELLTK